MKSDLHIVPATVSHLYELVGNLRGEDAAELASAGVGARRALYRGWRSSIMCRTALVDGHVGAVWGLSLGWCQGVSMLNDVGVPWLLTSKHIERVPIAFVRHARTEIAAMRAVKRRLENHVAADYVRAVRFLRLIGFTVDAPAPTGVNGALFCRFHMGEAA